MNTTDIRTACDDIDAQTASYLNQLAAKDAVIQAQAARIAELEAQLPPAYDYYVSATGTGDGSKDSPATPAGLDAALAAGKRNVALLAGTYPHNSIVLSHGGTSDKPAVISAVGGKVTFVGNRTAWTKADSIETGVKSVTSGWVTGAECFVLRDGANWLTFDGINIQRHSRAFALYGNVEGLVIQNAPDCYNNQDFLWNNYTTPAGARNVTVRNVVQIGFSKSMIRWSGNSEGLLVEDCLGDSGWQVSDKFAMGVFISDTAHGVVCRRVVMQNCLDVQSWDNTKYWNGDGFCGENETYDILMEDTVSKDNSDGGYDFKTHGVTFRRAKAEGNKKNFRLWGTAVLEDCESVNPHKVNIESHPGAEGGSSGVYHVEAIGGRSADDLTVITMNTPMEVHKTLPDSTVTTWYGQVNLV